MVTRTGCACMCHDKHKTYCLAVAAWMFIIISPFVANQLSPVVLFTGVCGAGTRCMVPFLLAGALTTTAGSC